MPGLHPALGATSTAHDSDSLFSSPDGIKGRAAEEKGVSPAGESGVSSPGKSRSSRVGSTAIAERAGDLAGWMCPGGIDDSRQRSATGGERRRLAEDAA